MNNIGIGEKVVLRWANVLVHAGYKKNGGGCGIRVSTLKVHLMQDTESVTIRAYHMPPSMYTCARLLDSPRNNVSYARYWRKVGQWSKNSVSGIANLLFCLSLFFLLPVPQ